MLWLCCTFHVTWTGRLKQSNVIQNTKDSKSASETGQQRGESQNKEAYVECEIIG